MPESQNFKNKNISKLILLFCAEACQTKLGQSIQIFPRLTNFREKESKTRIYSLVKVVFKYDFLFPKHVNSVDLT